MSVLLVFHFEPLPWFSYWNPTLLEMGPPLFLQGLKPVSSLRGLPGLLTSHQLLQGCVLAVQHWSSLTLVAWPLQRIYGQTSLLPPPQPQANMAHYPPTTHWQPPWSLLGMHVLLLATCFILLGAAHLCLSSMFSCVVALLQGGNRWGSRCLPRQPVLLPIGPHNVINWFTVWWPKSIQLLQLHSLLQKLRQILFVFWKVQILFPNSKIHLPLYHHSGHSV